jgi:leucyl-tRNA synthetase
MAVPAHDIRDFEFAQKFDLEIRQSIHSEKIEYTGEFATTVYGILVHS